ncbi:MAG: nuclear transport factor 2 family protein [Solirubrobacteraceae bacterium]
MTDNEAVVRAVFDQTARGDSDAATESFAPGAEIGSLAHPERVLRGPEDVRGYLAEMESAGETFEAVPERFVSPPGSASP